MALAKSRKLQQEEEDVVAVQSDPTTLIKTIKRDEVIRILPLTTLNEWVVIIQFAMDSTLMLPESMQHLDRGMVVGVSQTILTPEGKRVSSQLQPGDMVLFQEKSKVKDLDWSDEPYRGKKLIVISERNILLRLPPVKFEVYQPAE